MWNATFVHLLNKIMILKYDEYEKENHQETRKDFRQSELQWHCDDFYNLQLTKINVTLSRL